MAIPRISATQALIKAEYLTPESFAPFGTVITSPLPASAQAVPSASTRPPPLHPSHQPDAVVANQSTAFKYAPISPFSHNYPQQSSPLMSMFCCFPRKIFGGAKFPVKVLERHPYTTQTFAPLGLPTFQSFNSTSAAYLVIVAPSCSDPVRSLSGDGRASELVERPPDTAHLRAFIADGGQAVTYAVGTWHAPMVVLGPKRIDFVVTQFVSGIPEEDCQEVELTDGLEVEFAPRIEANLNARL